MKSVARKNLLRMFGFLLIAASFAVPGSAAAVVYFDPMRLVARHFRGVDEVTTIQVRANAIQRNRIEARLGRRLAQTEYTFYVAKTAGQVDGYALLDRERGHRAMIGFATFLDNRGFVTGVEVTEFNEPLGGAIRTHWYREQFVGRGPNDRFRPDYDIETPWQALDSSDAACRAVHRAVVLVDELLVRREVTASASDSTATSSNARAWWLTSGNEIISRRGGKALRESSPLHSK